MFKFLKSSKSKSRKMKSGLSQKPSVDTALENARAAKAHLGEDTVHKIAQSVQNMEARQAKIDQARSRLASEADAEMVAHEILEMIQNKKGRTIN